MRREYRSGDPVRCGERIGLITRPGALSGSVNVRFPDGSSKDVPVSEVAEHTSSETRLAWLHQFKQETT